MKFFLTVEKVSHVLDYHVPRAVCHLPELIGLQLHLTALPEIYEVYDVTV